MTFGDAHIQRLKALPHWRIVASPNQHEAERIPSLSACWEVMEKRRLMLRGWDYPHVGNQADERVNGPNWIGGGSAFGSHLEYWRLFQSGQFLHLLALREATAPGYVEAARAAARDMLRGGDPASVKGTVDVIGLLYTITEVHIFAAGLVSQGVYRDKVTIELQLVNAKEFVLIMDVHFAWWDYCRNTESPLGNTWIYPADDLAASAAAKALDATVWFLERFGWMKPNVQSLQLQQGKFLRREW